MAIESKNLLVWVKAMARGQALPLDASEVYTSYDEASVYAASATAYAGQTIKALLSDGKYHTYVLQPSDAGYVLEEVGAVTHSDLKQYVMVVDALPTSGMQQGILYICGTTGSIWTGTAWKEVFKDLTATFDGINERIDNAEEELDLKAPIANPVFTGTIKVDEEEVALKSYVDGIIANMVSTVPGIVDGTHALPVEDYRAGETFRVAESGIYAGHECEVGDLIIVLNDHVAETASDADFMVVQANIDGAVTSSAETATIGEIVVFDAVTGKVVAGSGIQIDSLKTAMAKAHEHSNMTVLNSFDKTQTQILETAAADAAAQIATYKESVDDALDLKANTADLVDAYSKAEVDALLSPITTNLNTKVDGPTVDNKIADAKTDFLDEAAANAAAALEDRVGGIAEDTTIKSYIDSAVNNGTASSAESIATAKQEAVDAAKGYTDAQLAAKETSLKSYIDAQDGATLTAAKDYSDAQLVAALTVTEF